MTKNEQSIPCYLPAVLELAGDAVGVVHVTVLHDDWCALLNRRGPCNCDPVVTAGPPGTPH